MFSINSPKKENGIGNTMHASVTSLRVDDLETLLNDLSEQ